MCGVLHALKDAKKIAEGSSPHVRGFARLYVMQSSYSRFIPACAGFCRRSHRSRRGY